MSFSPITKTFLVWGGMLALLAGVVSAFLYLTSLKNQEQNHLQDRLYDASVLMSDSIFTTETLSAKKQPVTKPKATVLHYYNPDCPCTRYNTWHVKDLIKEFTKQGVRFEIRVPHESQVKDAELMFNRPAKVAEKGSVPIASPSALVLDAKMNPQYIGPYSPAATCNLSKDDFVGNVLNDLLAGEVYPRTRNLALGCICDWPSNP
jgi:hypothetical protein